LLQLLNNAFQFVHAMIVANAKSAMAKVNYCCKNAISESNLFINRRASARLVQLIVNARAQPYPLTSVLLFLTVSRSAYTNYALFHSADKSLEVARE